MTEKHKTCFKCGETKPLSDFYKHPKMTDGHVNKCKECNKVDVGQNRRDKIDYYQEYDRNRGRNHLSDRYLKRLSRNRSPEYKESESYAHKISLGKTDFSRSRKVSNSAVSNAIRDGKLTRPNCCEYCGKSCKPQAHHSSYADDMKLTVTWLCTECHGKVHRKYD
jgi:hypothetical protein